MSYLEDSDKILEGTAYEQYDYMVGLFAIAEQLDRIATAQERANKLSEYQVLRALPQPQKQALERKLRGEK